MPLHSSLKNRIREPLSTLDTRGRTGRCVLAAVVFAVSVLPARASCLDLSGNVSTHFRAYEDTSYHFISYDHLRLKATAPSLPGFSFQTHVRWAADLQEDVSGTENTRLYSALVAWKSSGEGLGIEIGRRFYYMGVGNGTLDGLMLSLRHASAFRLTAYAGMEAPVSREAEIHKWSEANVYGLHLRGGGKAGAWEMSWVRKSRMENVYWHQVGMSLKAGLGRSLQTLIRADYNLAASEMQMFRLQGIYRVRSLRIWGEGSVQAPRIAEDSYFRIFDVDGFSQLRLGARCGFPERMGVGLEFIETQYEVRTARRVRIKIEGGVFDLGVQLRGGNVPGEQTAFFGGVNHAFGSLRARLDFDVAQYKLHDQDEVTDEKALTAEIEWRPAGGPLSARFQLERLVNRQYDPDYRGYGRLSLDF